MCLVYRRHYGTMESLRYKNGRRLHPFDGQVHIAMQARLLLLLLNNDIVPRFVVHYAYTKHLIYDVYAVWSSDELLSSFIHSCTCTC